MKTGHTQRTQKPDNRQTRRHATKPEVQTSIRIHSYNYVCTENDNTTKNMVFFKIYTEMRSQVHPSKYFYINHILTNHVCIKIGVV